MTEPRPEQKPAQLARLAGALLLRQADTFILIGNTKEPCDWAAAGFHAPPELTPANPEIRPLTLTAAPIPMPPTALTLDCGSLPPDRVAAILANKLLIRRNASVSDRLWRIITGLTEESTTDSPLDPDATWLLTMPERVWNLVRDAALKCL